MTALSRSRNHARAARLAGLMGLLLLAACAGRSETRSVTETAPPPPETQVAAPQAFEYQRLVNELRRASQCVIAAEDQPKFAPLRNKAPGSGALTAAFLTNNAKANQTERQLIEEFLKAIAPCEPDFGIVTVRQHQSIARMINDTWRRQEQLYGLLRDGAVSWGKFNQDTKANADKLSGGLEALRLINES